MTSKVLKNHALPVQIEGFPYIFGGLLLTLACLTIWYGGLSNPELLSSLGRGVVCAGTLLFGSFTLFSAWFYRCPKVDVPSDDPGAVLSPANGRVLFVDEVSGARIGEAKAKRIAIFMSPFDVHVNRAPIEGAVETVSYHKGKFFKADLDKASEENEHNWVVMRSAKGTRVAFVQIAGFIARRIVCYVERGESLARGERYGMIRFGSRMEILVPSGAEVLVRQGERTVAGLTKVARIKS